MNLIRLSISLLAIAFLCSCVLAQDKPDAQPDDKPADKPADKADDKADEPKPEAKPPAERPMSVTLLEQGGEPRRELRYAVSEGDVQRFIAAHRNTTTQMVLGMVTPPTRDPEIRAHLESRITKVDEDGTITARLRVARVDLVEQPNVPATPGMRRAAQDMGSAEADLTIDARGLIRSLNWRTKLTGPAGLLIGAPHEIIEQNLRASIVAFPNEPIGDGARWRVEEARRENDVIVERAVTYTLKRHEGNRLELEVEVAGSAKPQPIVVDWNPSLALNNFASTSSGTAVASLDNIIPETLTRAGALNLEVQVNTHRMGQTTDSTTSITPAPADQPKNDAQPQADR